MSSIDQSISTKKSRWTRISQLTPVEEVELLNVTQNTAGMSLYGNRARTSVMLPLSWHELSLKKQKSEILRSIKLSLKC